MSDRPYNIASGENLRTGDHNDSGRSGCTWIAGLIILALAALAIAYLLHIHI